MGYTISDNHTTRHVYWEVPIYNATKGLKGTMFFLPFYKIPLKHLMIWECQIKTHDSESQGQEEAGHTQQTSELFTRSTAMKFVDALNKPPFKLSLSYLGLSTF